MKYHVTILLPTGTPGQLSEATQIIEADNLEVGDDGTLVFVRYDQLKGGVAMVIAVVKQYSFVKHDDIVPRVAIPPR
jgi:hypothetical protein